MTQLTKRPGFKVFLAATGVVLLAVLVALLVMWGGGSGTGGTGGTGGGY